MAYRSRILAALAALVLALLVAVGFGVVTSPSRQLSVVPAPPVEIDRDAAARRLAASLAFKTISHAPGLPPASAEFKKLHAHLQASFPKAHAALQREVVAEFSLLYTWPGSDPSAAGLMVLAHQDVVPIAPGSEDDWQFEPFAGVVSEGFVWGRGAWDNKGNLYALMEAVETLAAQGFKPRQTLYFAFGHDEELGGAAGAGSIAKLLALRKVRLAAVIDEGLLVTEGILKGLLPPAALIGIAEKGYLTVDVTASGEPGHSSMPPRRTAIGELTRVLSKIEQTRMPSRLRGVAREMLETLAPEMQWPYRVLMSNLWLLSPLVIGQMEKNPATNAMLRTTMAPTALRSGEKDNVLPGMATAVVNFRILPGDSSEDIMERLRAAVGTQATLVARPGGSEPSAMSSTQTETYRSLHRTIREVFPGAAVAPGLMIAATDSRHMAALADQIYRFSPVRAGPGDLARFHGTNERLSIANYAEMIRFYYRLLGNLNGPQTRPTP